jgi:hypothetical protein
MARSSHAKLNSPLCPDALTTPRTFAMKTPLPGALIDTETPTSTLVSKRKLIWDNVTNDAQFDGFTCALVQPKPKRQKNGPKKKSQKIALSPTSGDPKKSLLDASNIVQPNPFSHAKLNETCYSITPAMPWECTTGYRIATSTCL